MTEPSTDNLNTPFWQSRKLWRELLAVVVLLVLTMTDTVTFTADQVVTVILGILGIGVGAHAASDVTSQIMQGLNINSFHRYLKSDGEGNREPLLKASQVERLIELATDTSQLTAEEPKSVPLEVSRDEEEGPPDR